MRKLSTVFIVMLAFVFSVNAQTTDYQQTHFLKYRLISKTKNTTEFVLSHKLLKDTEALFCMVDYSDKLLVVLVDSNVDSQAISQELTDLGFTFELKMRERYSDDLFSAYYQRSKNLTEVEGEQTMKLSTRNSEKDEVNFQKIKQILN